MRNSLPDTQKRFAPWRQANYARHVRSKKAYMVMIGKQVLKWSVGLLLGLFAVSVSADVTETARFNVTDRVIAADLPAFTATIGGMGNGGRLTGGNSGFEPLVYRTQFNALEDAPNRIVGDFVSLSEHYVLRSGALDGAEVDVFRVENTKMRLVRQDRVRSGGHHASGWRALQKNGQALAANAKKFQYRWPVFFRPEASYWFSVRAVDRRGNLSEPSVAVQVRTPATIKRGKRAKVKTKRYEEPDTPGAARVSAPGNVSVEHDQTGLLTLGWDAPQSGRVAGYRVYITETRPDQHQGYALDLVGSGPDIKTGDLVILRHKFYSRSRAQLYTNRVWDASEARQSQMGWLLGYSDEPKGGLWSLKPHDPATPVAHGGETYLSLDVPPGNTAVLRKYNHSGTAQDWYPILDPDTTYILSVWLRGQSPKPLKFGMLGRFRSRQIVVTPTSQWKLHQIPFRVPLVDQGSEPGGMEIAVPAGAQVDMDNLRVYAEGVPYLGLLPEDRQRLQNSGMSALRTHGFIKTGSFTYDIDGLTNPGGAASGSDQSMTLPQVFELMSEGLVNPWLQIEPHLSRDEWLAFAEYLAAPYDNGRDTPITKPWAAKRVGQGRADPWIDAFDTVHLELGNETWNRLFAPWVYKSMPNHGTDQIVRRGQAYGLYTNYVISILQESPYWAALEPKLVPVLGGWSGKPYTSQAASVAQHGGLIGIASYVGGWDEQEGPPAPTARSFAHVLAHFAQRATARAEKLVEDAGKQPVGAPPLTATIYEAGPGYALNGLNRRSVSAEEMAAQETVMKSNAGGTATLDSFLGRAAIGVRVQNFFQYGAGRTWSSHAEWHNGGQVFPSWALLTLINREALGDMLEVQTKKVPTRDLPKSGGRDAVKNAPEVAVYATRNGRRMTIVAVSRRMPGIAAHGDAGRIAVTVDLPIRNAERVTRYRMSGAYDTHNVFENAAQLISEPYPVSDQPGQLEIPVLKPGESLIFVFDGIS
jgi:hypothetical protein